MREISNVYSKGRGKKANQEWEEDSTKKQSTASKEVIEATDFFLKDIFARLEELSAAK
jgi:hypothetical protein